MTGAKDRVHPSIYLLADHLDAALAIAEDLQSEAERLPRPPRQGATAADIEVRHRALRAFLDTVRKLEVLLVGRVMGARTRADELRRLGLLPRPLASLFAAGTVALVDAVAEFGDATDIDFDTGDNALTFLRQRALIEARIGFDQLDQLAVGEGYLVARRIHLGTLMDLLATFLDTLDSHYDLYEPAAADETGDDAGDDATPRRLAGAAADLHQAT